MSELEKRNPAKDPAYRCLGCKEDLLLDLDKNPNTTDFVVCKSCFTPTHKDCANTYGCSTYACRSREFHEGTVQTDGLEAMVGWIDGNGAYHQLTNPHAEPARTEQKSKQESIVRRNNRRIARRMYHWFRNAVATTIVFAGVTVGYMNGARADKADDEYEAHPNTQAYQRLSSASSHLEQATRALTYDGSNPIQRDDGHGKFLDWDRLPEPQKARDELMAANEQYRQSGHFYRPSLEARINGARESIKDQFTVEIDAGKIARLNDYPDERAQIDTIRKDISELCTQAERMRPAETLSQTRKYGAGMILGFCASFLGIFSFALRRRRDD